MIRLSAIRSLHTSLIAMLLVAGCSGERGSDVAAQARPAPQTAVSGEVTVLGVHFELIDAEPCRVKYRRGENASEIRLLIPPPCVFHRDRNGAVRVQQVKEKQVMLVERSSPDREHPGDCDTRVQAIVVSDDAVQSSPGVERVAMCTPFRWDDVMFIGLAESVPHR